MLPVAFLERMQRLLGEEYGAFLEAFGQERYQALRLNPLKRGTDEMNAAEKLSTGWEEARGDKPAFAHLTEVPWAENGYYYQAGDQPGKHPWHQAGLYYIQEPSAMAPVEVLEIRPGERVLDLCAAPGGKTAQIAAKLRGSGLLVCNEIHPARAKILSENVERMGIGNVCVLNETPERLAEAFPEYFDAILVDAPCSGEGMFRKNEEACGEWNPENVALCAARQKKILDCAAGMLRPGGRLVYSTCTFAPEENEGSVSSFLKDHDEFQLLPINKGMLINRETPINEEMLKNEEIPINKEMLINKKTLNKGSAGTGGCDGRPEWIEDPVPGLEGTLRLWPQHVKGEGHFAALLEKAGPNPERYLQEDAGIGGRVRQSPGRYEGCGDIKPGQNSGSYEGGGATEPEQNSGRCDRGGVIRAEQNPGRCGGGGIKAEQNPGRCGGGGIKAEQNPERCGGGDIRAEQNLRRCESSGDIKPEQSPKPHESRVDTKPGRNSGHCGRGGAIRAEQNSRRCGGAMKPGKTDSESVEFLDFFRENMNLFPQQDEDAGETSEQKATSGSGNTLLKEIARAAGLNGEAYRSIRFGDNVYLAPADYPSLKGLKVLRPGLHLGECKKGRFEPSHALAMAIAPGRAAHIWNLDSGSPLVNTYLNGQTFPAQGEKGWYLICVDGFGLGWGKLAGNVMKNHYPRGLRR